MKQVSVTTPLILHSQTPHRTFFPLTFENNLQSQSIKWGILKLISGPSVIFPSDILIEHFVPARRALPKVSGGFVAWYFHKGHEMSNSDFEGRM